MSTCDLYFEHAWMLEDGKILDAAKQACLTHIMELKPKTCRLAHVTDLGFLWKDFVESCPKSVEISAQLSLLIAAFCGQNEISKEDFVQLTSKEYLPVIHIQAALNLLDLERRIVDESAQNSLSNLQNRCIHALFQGWHTFSLDSSGMAVLHEQHPVVLTKILSRVLSAAKSENKRIKEESADLGKKCEDLKNECAELKKKCADYKADMDGFVRYTSAYILIQ